MNGFEEKMEGRKIHLESRREQKLGEKKSNSSNCQLRNENTKEKLFPFSQTKNPYASAMSIGRTRRTIYWALPASILALQAFFLQRLIGLVLFDTKQQKKCCKSSAPCCPLILCSKSRARCLGECFTCYFACLGGAVFPGRSKTALRFVYDFEISWQQIPVIPSYRYLHATFWAEYNRRPQKIGVYMYVGIGVHGPYTGPCVFFAPILVGQACFHSPFFVCVVSAQILCSFWHLDRDPCLPVPAWTGKAARGKFSAFPLLGLYGCPPFMWKWRVPKGRRTLPLDGFMDGAVQRVEKKIDSLSSLYAATTFRTHFCLHNEREKESSTYRR